MATRIRLRRVGRKKQPLYRIVVADSRAARDGTYVAAIGQYNPRSADAARTVTVEIEKAREWLARGARPTDTVRSLLKKAGVFQQG